MQIRKGPLAGALAGITKNSFGSPKKVSRSIGRKGAPTGFKVLTRLNWGRQME
jgi:hypothetical protein